jgi:hypothetical protein
VRKEIVEWDTNGMGRRTGMFVLLSRPLRDRVGSGKLNGEATREVELVASSKLRARTENNVRI